MRLEVLGSSSAGNCYLLTSSAGETLIIETGVSLMKVKEALNFDLTGVVASVSSHGHADHTGKINEYLNAGIKCYLSPETAKMKGPHHNIKVVQERKTYQIGSFKITPFALRHDIENYGYILWHEEMGFCPFITDTWYCPFVFPGMNNLLLEVNYDEKIIDRKLQEGTANIHVRNRVIQSHIEIQTAIDFLKANDLSKVNNIVLIHLSESNSNAAEFQKRIKELTGKSVYVAIKGMSIPFDKQPF